LLGVAIRALKRAVRTGTDDASAAAKGDLHGSGRLKEPGASFVTLRKHGDLRGCIGTLSPNHPLWESVASNAAAAALRDDRFTPLTPDELRALEAEVSVLSAMKPIPSWRAFRLGADGIVLHKGLMSAVFLPDVATEQGWTTEQLLEELSEKAGLPKTAWQSG